MPEPTEDNLSYDGWGVVAASAVGVYVSFASVFVYTFGVFLKPAWPSSGSGLRLLLR